MEKEQLTVALLESVETETLRFLQKVKECKDRIIEEKKNKSYCYNTKETGAVKRAALDLKNDLTRITQSTAF